ncbi:RHS repeat-associated core domain-containing protein [Chryseobacterium vietnamense]|uniref:RHS repeat-associated core domain-containing protein n=1 Tax=Chryseobacterium vietnamense TaxID=866785 RepID=UPI00286A337C|nr:RHS repeat-associated core domain-containing protein [Chryseobacterium vietnamense]
MIDTNNYYPFGLNHISGAFSTSNFGSFYSYKYNGKELQESGMYDYGARMYMPDLGRWGVIDPLAETSRGWSTYAYAYNNPVMFIDPDGRENVSALHWKFDRNSTILGNSWFDDSYVSSGFGNNFKTMWNGGDHGGSGSRPFVQTQAFADLMDAFYNGGTFGLTNSNGVMTWWTDLPDSYDEEGNRVKTIGAFGILKFKNYSVDNIDWNYTGSTFWNAAKLTANMADFAYSRMADYHFYDGPWMKRGWRNANGVWNDASVLARQANGRFVRGAAGKRIAAANAKAFAGSLGKIAHKAAIVGYALDAAEALYDGKVKAGEISKIGINVIAGTIGPVGWAWIAADIGVAFFNNGKGLNDIIAEQIDNSLGNNSTLIEF